MASQESCYIALLGLAEHFRSLSPPDISKCVHCLQAVLTVELPPKAKARTHFQMGSVLFTYTKNLDLAVHHLEYAWKLSYSCNAFDDFMFDADSTLAVLYERQGYNSVSISILKRSIEVSQRNVFWHSRLLLQLSQFYVSDGMYTPACELLGIGVDYAKISSAKYYEVLFLSSQCMVFLKDNNFPEGVLEQIDSILETWEGEQSYKTYLEGFFLVLMVCYYIKLGRMKTAEPYLKRLQQNILDLMCMSSSDMVECELKNGTAFCWMHKEHLRVLVYVVTLIHHMLGGCVKEALKYVEKTLVEIRKLKATNEGDFLVVLEMICIEHMVMCKIVAGRNCNALSLISNACSLCSDHPKLLEQHRPQLHALLGMYAMAVDCVADAEQQFNIAMKLTPHEELKTFLNLNLAILFVKGRRNSEIGELLVKINPANFASCSQSMRIAAYLIFGLLELLEGRYSDGTKFLDEVMKMANAEYVRRLTACSLVLHGHVFLTQGRRQECLDFLTAAMELTASTGDVLARLWCLSVFKDLHEICPDAQRKAEIIEMHSSLSETLMMDRSQASKMPEHCLIYWTSGDVPSLSNWLMEV